MPLPGGDRGSSDTSLLFLADLLTMVMGSLAAQHVQPCPRNLSALNEFCQRRRALFPAGEPASLGPVAQLVRAHP